jgi:uncharacterized membrane protein YhiD involved in acid resistance
MGKIMDEVIANFAVSSSIDLMSFVLSMFGVLVMIFSVAFHYNKYFPHVSRSQSMGQTLLVISLITFLIITVVKSSLALSLGLVGALSIIRFRTPIKEPFELSYLFMAIAIGLGFGANQWMPTVTAIFFTLMVLTFYVGRTSRFHEHSYFIYITLEREIGNEELKNSITSVSERSQFDIDLRRIDKSKTATQITFNTRIKTDNDLLTLNQILDDVFGVSTISIVDNQKLMPF